MLLLAVILLYPLSSYSCPRCCAMNRPDPLGLQEPAHRDPDIAFDPITGQIRESYTQGGVETSLPLVASMDQYATLLSTRTYRKLWRDGSRESRSVTRGSAKKPG